MIVTNGDMISRIRRELKAVKQDAFLTDRFLYSVLLKHAFWMMKREDTKNRILSINDIVQPIPFIELEEVDKVEAGCRGIQSHVTIKRTRAALPAMFEGVKGVLLRNVTSLDSSQEVLITDAASYLNMTRQTSFRYNKNKYCWYINGYLYFPDLEWDAVRIEGVFVEDVTHHDCPDCERCSTRQEHAFNVPAFLHAELEAQVLKDLRDMFGIPHDQAHDNLHPAS